jgi:methionyl-tRNA formyltransferase
MAREDRTGVTLQTLDEKSFDYGTILAQTIPPGLPIPWPDTCTYNDLLEFIKPKAASLLVKGIRDRVFVPPLVDVGKFDSENIKHAPKITPQDKMILWDEWDAETIYARHRALGRLWTTLSRGDNENLTKRIIFEDFEVLEMPWLPDFEATYPSVVPEHKGNGVYQFCYYVRNGEGPVYIFCKDRTTLKVREITVEGGGKKSAYMAMRELGCTYMMMREDWDEDFARNSIVWDRKLARKGEAK